MPLDESAVAVALVDELVAHEWDKLLDIESYSVRTVFVIFYIQTVR